MSTAPKGIQDPQKPVPLDNIILKGESIGAAILTVAAEQFSKEKNGPKSPERQEPYVYNSRSFSSLGMAAAGFITKNKTIGRLLGRAADFILDKIDCNIHAGRSFTNLRADRKDYLVVKQDKKDPESKGDNIIANFASLHKHKDVQAERRKQKADAKGNNQRDTLEEIKSQHKATSKEYSNLHNVSLDKLTSKNKNGKSGLNMFQNFVDNAKNKQKNTTNELENNAKSTPNAHEKKARRI